MKIGIMGLLPEQVRIVQQEFPAHALTFLSKDRQGDTGQFAKGCDKVVMMTNFIGHDMQQHVPPRKRVFVTGGMEKLKRTLNELPTPVKVTTPPKPAPAAQPATRGRGRWGDVEVIDWTALRNASEVGQVITILRPSSCTLAAFQKRVEVKRSTMKTQHGIVTEIPKFIDGAALITVKALTGKRVATIETGPPDATPPAPATQETHDMQIAIEVQRPMTTAPMLTQARESAFWQSVFVETMRQWPGAPIDTIAARADEALRAYNARASLPAVSQH